MELHFLNARGRCAPAISTLRQAVSDAQAILAPLGPVLRLDLVVKVVKWLPDSFRCSGFAPMAGVIELNLNPKHLAAPELADEALRMLLHEYHHALRWDGPGYGTTLGEALVSEGLAQLFVHQLLERAPEPWEFCCPEPVLRAHGAEALAGFDRAYSHVEWFFGQGRPHWLGYALGRRIVAAGLDGAPPMRRATSLRRRSVRPWPDLLIEIIGFTRSAR